MDNIKSNRSEGKVPRLSFKFFHKWKDNKGVSRKLYWRGYRLGVKFEKDQILNIEKKSTGMAVNEIYTEKYITDRYNIIIWLLIAEIRLSYISKIKPQ